MAQTYVGVVRWAPGVPTQSDIERLRSEGMEAVSELLQKVRQLPANLPPTCKLVGAWSVATRDLTSFMVVEAESSEDLQAISTYYVGWFQIDWHPAAAVERD